MSAKGYIVRLDEPGGSVFAVRSADTPRGVALTTHRERATEYSTVSEAVRGWWAMAFANARIFAVAEDGTETPLPTYEEALALLADLRVFAAEEAAAADDIANDEYMTGKAAALFGIVRDIDDPSEMRSYMTRPGTLLAHYRQRRAAANGSESARLRQISTAVGAEVRHSDRYPACQGCEVCLVYGGCRS
jgi:hypothetical protein